MADQVSPDNIQLVALGNRLAAMGHGAPVQSTLPGIYVGTAVPTFSANQGSLYLRQNGASSTPYVNTSAANPGTTWTAVTVP